MKDQSQINEMRAAIRGDLERSRERQRPSAAVLTEEHVVPDAPERPAEDTPRSGFLSSFFRRR